MRTRNNRMALAAVALAAAVAVTPVTGAAAVGGGAAGWMLAQQGPQADPAPQSGGQSAKQSTYMQQHILAGDLIGLDVYNDEGVQLGMIKDVVLDREHRQVAYIALARGGFIGIGEDLYPIPWDQVSADFAQDRATVPIQERVLENAQPLDERASKMRRVSELTGMQVDLVDAGEAAAGQERDQSQSLEERFGTSGNGGAGELEDVLVNSSGQAVFALIRPNTEVLRQLREYHVLAVPWMRIDVRSEDERLLADVTPEEVEQLAVSQYELARLDEQSFAERLFGAVGEEMPRAEQPQAQVEQQAEQPEGVSEQMQKWSDFTQQCLGPNMDRADQMVEGRVENVGTLYTSPEAEAPDGLRFVVVTLNNEEVTVYAGPRGDVSQQLNLYRGDQVRILGTRCDIENEQVFVATEIETNGEQYELTKRDGAPHWESRGEQGRLERQPQR